VSGYKLGRDTAHRRAMWRNMAVALFSHGQIQTTVAKAKSVQPLVEQLITAARKGDLASRRRVLKTLHDPIIVKHDEDDDVTRNKYGELLDGPRVVKKLFDEIAPALSDRPGGYTRIVRLGKHRIGDGSDLVVLQLVGNEEGPQLSGQYSRRRQKANRRMEYSAHLRRAASESATAVAEAPPPDEAEEGAAVTEAPPEGAEPAAEGAEGETDEKAT
jgi:large subunit ribosomal protein L17